MWEAVRPAILVIVLVTAACSAGDGGTTGLPTLTTTSPPEATPSTATTLRATSTPDPTVSAPTSIVEAGDLDTAELIAFVEAAREQEFSSPPSIRLLPVDEQPPEGGPEQVGELDWSFAQIMGLTGDTDRATFDAFIERWLADAGYGFCCPVVAREEEDPDLTAAIVVHELVHVIDRMPPNFGGSLEARLPALALAEGNAIRIEEEFVQSIGRTLEEIRNEDDELPEEAPTALMALTWAPYVEGYSFARAIAAAGGEQAIDAAIEAQPISAEQVLFPEKYMAGEEPADVERPATPEGFTFARFGTIGAFVLKLAIEPAIGADEALGLVEAWAGDAYVLATSDAEVCMVAAIVMDDVESAEALAAALNASLAPNVVEAEEVSVLFEHCAPSS